MQIPCQSVRSKNRWDGMGRNLLIYILYVKLLFVYRFIGVEV